MTNSLSEDIKLKMFLRWLKEKNIYFKYKRAFICQWSVKTHEKPLDYLRKILNRHFISVIKYTIFWKKTTEGHHFWAEISNEWRNFVKENNL